MSTLLLVVVGMIVAMALLVLYSSHLFEENRTRVSRRSPEVANPTATSGSGELEWCTLVDPVEARNRARASAPFARAYARAMAGEDDTRAA